MRFLIDECRTVDLVFVAGLSLTSTTTSNRSRCASNARAVAACVTGTRHPSTGALCQGDAWPDFPLTLFKRYQEYQPASIIVRGLYRDAVSQFFRASSASVCDIAPCNIASGIEDRASMENIMDDEKIKGANRSVDLNREARR